MPLGLIVEAATRILRRRGGVLLALSLLVVGPGILLTSSVELRLTDVMGELVPVDEAGRPVLATPALSREEIDRVLGAVATFMGASAIAGILGAIAALGFSAIVAAALRAVRSTWGARSGHASGAHRRPWGSCWSRASSRSA